MFSYYRGLLNSTTSTKVFNVDILAIVAIVSGLLSGLRCILAVAVVASLMVKYTDK